LPLLHREGDAFDGGKLAVALHQVADDKRRRRGAGTVARWRYLHCSLLGHLRRVGRVRRIQYRDPVTHAQILLAAARWSRFDERHVGVYWPRTVVSLTH